MPAVVRVTIQALEKSADLIPQLELLSRQMYERPDSLEFVTEFAAEMLWLLNTYQILFTVA